MYFMTRRKISSNRTVGVAALALVTTFGVFAPSTVFADEPADTTTADQPVAEPASETGQVDGAVVAVGTPPVPPTTVVVAVGQPPATVVVAVGQPPVPPTADVVAVGQPPVPPTKVVVAVGQPPVPKAPAAARQSAQPTIVVSADALKTTADAAFDVLDDLF